MRPENQRRFDSGVGVGVLLTLKYSYILAETVSGGGQRASFAGPLRPPPQSLADPGTRLSRLG